MGVSIQFAAAFKDHFTLDAIAAHTIWHVVIFTLGGYVVVGLARWIVKKVRPFVDAHKSRWLALLPDAIYLLTAFLLSAALIFLARGQPPRPLPDVEPYAERLAALSGDVGGKKSYLFIAEMEVLNKGTPTSLRGWSLLLIDGSNNSTECHFISSPPPKEAAGSPLGDRSRDDWLPFKVTDRVLPEGGVATGFLMFQAPENLPEVINRATVVRVKFKDVFDREYVCDWTRAKGMIPSVSP